MLVSQLPFVHVNCFQRRMMRRACRYVISVLHNKSISTQTRTMSEAPIYKFMKTKSPTLKTQFLFVGNCGPGVPGMTTGQIHALFAPFSADVVIPNEQSTFVHAIFESEDDAAKCHDALQGQPCPAPNQRTLVVRYSDAVKVQADRTEAPARGVARTAAQLGVPGLELVLDFVTEEQESQLLSAVESHPWVGLAKRRVQHYGWEFDYASRSFSRKLGPLPEWASDVASRASAHPAVSQDLDQLTVNEYEPGVGLSPHVDTHSAFTGAIVSLSLGSDVVMEFRQGSDHRAVLLPRRSLLVMAGESRYAWQHYIPHRKQDTLGWSGPPTSQPHTTTSHSQAGTGDEPTSCPSTNTPAAPSAATSGALCPMSVGAAPPQTHTSPPYSGPGGPVLVRGRRVSLTLRQVRGFPCDCAFPQHCDSRAGGAPPTRLAMLGLQGAGGAGSAAGGATEGVEMQGLSKTAQSDTAVVATAGGAQPGQTEGGESDRDAALTALEAQHVVAVYDAIASHFSATRFAIWPAVRKFMEALPSGAVVADVGCGNGKYFGVRKDVAVLGSDASAGLAQVAAMRVAAPGDGTGPERVPTADVLHADGMALPYRSSAFDGVLCIAVLHHISSVPRRLHFLGELARLLRTGGRAIVTVWAVEQEDPKKTIAKWTRIAAPDAAPSTRAAPGRPHIVSTTATAGADAVGGRPDPASKAEGGADYMVPWHLPFHRAGVAAAVQMATKSGRTAGDSVQGAAAGESSSGQGQTSGLGSMQAGSQSASRGSSPSRRPAGGSTPASLDTAKGAVVFQRYYHLFEQGEIDALVEQVPGVKAVDSFFDRSNWCIIFEKL